MPLLQLGGIARVDDLAVLPCGTTNIRPVFSWDGSSAMVFENRQGYDVSGKAGVGAGARHLQYRR